MEYKSIVYNSVNLGGDMEYKSIPFEVKEMSKESRTGVIAHSVYNSIDRSGDIATKGMFNKSWQEKKDIDFLFNHEDDQILGNVTGTYEDEEKAYTKVKFGKWKLADDVMEMADAGVIRGASFGFVTKKKEFIEVKGRKVRRLKEVEHDETSILTKIPVHPEAGIVSINKSADFMNYLKEIKSHIDNMDRFCRNANASDETIIYILNEVKQAKEIISKYDTVGTQLIIEPSASENEAREFADQLLLLTLKHF